MTLDEMAKATFPESEERAARCLAAMKAAAERCAHIVETSGCMCEPPGCYDAVCYEAAILKKIRALT